jgi:hypothetical protein
MVCAPNKHQVALLGLWGFGERFSRIVNIDKAQWQPFQGAFVFVALQVVP